MGIVDRLTGACRIGFGLAAVGRPGYINLGRAADLPADRTAEALCARAHDLLDQAYAGGVRYFDVARSYGRAEEFLARWLHARPDVDDPSTPPDGKGWPCPATATGPTAHDCPGDRAAMRPPG